MSLLSNIIGKKLNRVTISSGTNAQLQELVTKSKLDPSPLKQPLLPGEPVFCTDTKVFYIYDGVGLIKPSYSASDIDVKLLDIQRGGKSLGIYNGRTDKIIDIAENNKISQQTFFGTLYTNDTDMLIPSSKRYEYQRLGSLVFINIFVSSGGEFPLYKIGDLPFKPVGGQTLNYYAPSINIINSSVSSGVRNNYVVHITPDGFLRNMSYAADDVAREWLVQGWYMTEE
jgi:hypothetical protein